jgi:hypothetical protein
MFCGAAGEALRGPLKTIVREFAVKLAAIHRQKTQAYQGLRRSFLPKKRGKMRGKDMCRDFN